VFHCREMPPVAVTPHLVSFHGPALGRVARGALSLAAVSVIEREPAPSWAGQLLRYVVSVDARDPNDAVRRLHKALDGHGSFDGFAAEEG
jgi:hypothetical protein